MQAPIVDEISKGIFIVRDDLIIGGTKRIFLESMMKGADHVVYASPAYGGAQIAIAHTAREHGKQATIFVAKRKLLHPRTLEAKQAGAKIIQVPHGYLRHVQSKAKAYANETGALLLPFGLRTEEAIRAIADRALLVSAMVGNLDEVWCVGGSGVLVSGLQLGLVSRAFNVVQVGRTLTKHDVGCAKIIKAPELFDEDAEIPPPFPSCSNYDAKAWRFFHRSKQTQRLFWNVAR